MRFGTVCTHTVCFVLLIRRVIFRSSYHMYQAGGVKKVSISRRKSIKIDVVCRLTYFLGGLEKKEEMSVS